MLKRCRSLACLAAFASIGLASPIGAAPSQSEISKEINLTINAATAVISGLQSKINGASLAVSELEDGVLRTAFREQFRKLAGTELDRASDADLGHIRKLFIEAFNEVIQEFRPDMIKGGQDAFVPAFFRAQLLEQFNKRSHGKYQAVVTMRTSELINRDSAPDRVVSDKAVLEFVQSLLEKGDLDSHSRSIGGRLVSYFPMRITEPCAVCHQRNGLEQKVGAFGGATVIVVEASP
jgi:hypothetical protein